MSDETNGKCRRSSRKLQKLESAPEHSDNAVLPAKNKKRRYPAKGRLAELLNMPIDVLFEIFGHLHPLDVLNLARVTKDFRRILMHRSSSSVWKAARANVNGLPDCPPEMSEPQWAHLAFYQYCNLCLTSGIRNVDWRLRIRICSKCAKDRITEISPYLYNSESANPRDLVLWRPGKRGRIAYFHDEFLVVRAKYNAIEDPAERAQFLQDRKKELRKREEHSYLCETWASAQAQTRSHELRQLENNRKNDIIERLTLLGWGEEIGKIPYYDDLADHKLVKTPRQLTERIWNNIRKPLVNYMEEMKTKRLARELVQRVVARKRVAMNVLRRYNISQLPFSIAMPEPADFCRFPVIKDILDLPVDVDVTESSFADIIPLFPGIFEEWRTGIVRKLANHVKSKLGRSLTVDEAVEQLKLAVTVFKCHDCAGHADSGHYDHLLYDHMGYDDFDIYDEFGDYFSDISDEFDFDGDGLYHSKNPTRLLFYPTVLSHACLTIKRGWHHPATYDDPSIKLDMFLGYRQQWCCDSLEFDHTVSDIVKSLVETAGLDPAIATAADLDREDPRFACSQCALWDAAISDEVKVRTFGWRSAVKHRLERHFTNCEPWHLLAPSDRLEARKIVNREDDVPKNDVNSDDPPNYFSEEVWLCMHCYGLEKETTPMVFDTIRHHLSNQHHIDGPTLNEDYAMYYGALETMNSSHEIARISMNLPRP